MHHPPTDVVNNSLARAYEVVVRHRQRRPRELKSKVFRSYSALQEAGLAMLTLQESG